MDAFIACLLGLLGLAAFAFACLTLYALLGMWSAPIIALLAAGLSVFIASLDG